MPLLPLPLPSPVPNKVKLQPKSVWPEDQVPWQCKVQVQDMDSYNISLTPAQLQTISRAHNIFQTCYHAPIIRDHEHFQEWVVVGASGAYIKVPHQWKTRLIKALCKQRPIFASDYPIALSKGSVGVSIFELIRLLIDLRCPLVRVGCYGQKSVLASYFEPLPPIVPLRGGPSDFEGLYDLERDDLGDAETPTSNVNNWDWGVSFETSCIPLFKPFDIQAKKKYKMEHFPMFGPLGDDHGSIRFIIPKSSDPYGPHDDLQVKIYPLWVHALKALSTKHAASEVKTKSAARSRHGHFKEVLSVSKDMPHFLKGFRIEISIMIETAWHAIDWLNDLTYFNLEYWLHKKVISLKKVNLPDFSTNLQYFMDEAQKMGVFRGDNNHPTSQLEKLAVKELHLVTGYNRGTTSFSELNQQHWAFRTPPTPSTLRPLWLANYQQPIPSNSPSNNQPTPPPPSTIHISLTKFCKF